MRTGSQKGETMATERMPHAPNYVMGHATMETFGKHYTARARELLDKPSEEITANEVLAITYLLGIVDMTAIYLAVTFDGDVDAYKARIDATVEDYLSGTLNRG